MIPTSFLEIAANGIVTLSIILAGRNSIHTWWTGIVGCTLFALVFYQAKLHADVTLQIFFVIASALGWWQWLHGQNGRARAISRISASAFIWLVPAGLLATGAYGFLLVQFTDAYAPFVDSAILAFSIVAQLLLMQRKLETWAFWLVVNSIAVPLFFSRELYLTSVLYCVYWINAIVAFFHWRKQMVQPG